MATGEDPAAGLNPDHVDAIRRGFEAANEQLNFFRERLREASDRLGGLRPAHAAGVGLFAAGAAGAAVGLARAGNLAPVGAAAGRVATGLNNLTGAARRAALALSAVQNRGLAANTAAPPVPAAVPANRPAAQPAAPGVQAATFNIRSAVIQAQNVLIVPGGIPGAGGPAGNRNEIPAGRNPPALGPALPVARPPGPPVVQPAAPRGIPVGTPVSFPQARPVAFPTAVPVALAAGVAQANGLTAALTRAGEFLGKLRDKLDPFVQRVRFTFAVASASVAGFVRAGLSDSVEGFQLGQAFLRLSRGIAGVFLPVVNAATAAVNRLAGYFRGLSLDQQTQYLRWAGIAAGVGTLVGLLPRLVSGLEAAAAAGRAAAVSILGMEAAAAGPIGLAVAAVAAAAVALGAAFAVAYARSAELRASVARFGTVVAQAFATFRPVIVFLLDAMGRGFAFMLDAATFATTLAVGKIVSVWNYGMAEIMGTFKRLAVVMGTLADNLPVGPMKDFAEGVRGAFLDAALAANKLKLNANVKLPGGPGGPGKQPTPMQVGTETGEQTFRRLQDAVYGIKSPEEQQVDLLQLILDWLRGNPPGGQGQAAAKPIVFGGPGLPGV